MSTDVLKAMAHPVRRELLAALRHMGAGRAADLAAALGEPANRLSFHLRVLADAGLIEEAPELARDKRDRVWRPVRGGLTLGSPEDPVKDRELGDAVLAGLVADDHRLLDRVAAWAPRYTSGEDPVIRGAMEAHSLRLTRERFEELASRVDAVIEEFRADEGHHGTEDEVHGWQVLVLAASEEI